MDNKATINIEIPEEIKCETCIWANLPRNISCTKYKFKPSDVLYKGKDCEKYKKGEDEEDE